MPHKKVALQLIEETLKELESPKGSLLSAIQKLQRTSDIINDDDKKIWCAIQLICVRCPGVFTRIESITHWVSLFIRELSSKPTLFL